MTHDQQNHRGRMAHYMTLATKCHQQASSLRQEPSVSNLYARVASGYELLAYSIGALSHFVATAPVFTPE